MDIYKNIPGKILDLKNEITFVKYILLLFFYIIISIFELLCEMMFVCEVFVGIMVLNCEAMTEFVINNL